ncbi:MAG: diguanylate cyclase [Casimicrobium sp.]
MVRKRPVSISVQVSRVVVVTAAIAVVLTMVVMILVAALFARNIAQQRADTISELIASNADVPLVLKDAERGRETLSALAKSNAVQSARLIDASGAVLTSYVNPRTALTASQSPGAGWFERLGGATEFTALSPVVNRGDTLGYAEVTTREHYLSQALLGFVFSALGVLAVMLLIWAAIAAPIGRSLTLPLTRFAEVTRKIRDTEDFTHRVPSTRVFEVQELSEDFNAMLQVIQRRTAEVQHRNKQLAQLAFYDPLTGAANRVLLLDRIEQLIDSHRRNQRPFAVVGFDLDNFKLLNDQLGHQTGDAFLKAMSRRCKSELRPDDTFARLGGDEFIVLLPNVGALEHALTVAKKLAGAVHAANSVHTLPVSCTASMGVGLYPADGQSTNELIGRVDAAMYEAKAAGRNRIKFVRDIMVADEISTVAFHEK